MNEFKYGIRLNEGNGNVLVFFEKVSKRNDFLSLLNYGRTKASITLFEVSNKQEAKLND